MCLESEATFQNTEPMTLSDKVIPVCSGVSIINGKENFAFFSRHDKGGTLVDKDDAKVNLVLGQRALLPILRGNNLGRRRNPLAEIQILVALECQNNSRSNDINIFVLLPHFMSHAYGTNNRRLCGNTMKKEDLFLSHHNHTHTQQSYKSFIR